MPDYREMLMPPPPLEQDALVFTFIGASAVGKSTAAKAICELDAAQATPTWTTRQPRNGEFDTSYDHHFVSDELFDSQLAANGFIDYKNLYGSRYGLPRILKPAEGKEAFMVLKPVFIPAFLAYYRHARVYHIEASASVLPDRMRSRGQTEEDIAVRMRLHEEETAEAAELAHVTFDNNGSSDDMIQRVIAQMRADRIAFNVGMLDSSMEEPELPVTL